MASYCFVCDECGGRIEKFGSMEKPPKRTKCKCGSWKTRRDFQSELGVITGDTWNQTGGFTNERHETGSLSRAVHADQVKEQMEVDKEKGVNVGVEWKPDGRGLVRPHFSSKRARDNWDRANNFTSESHY